VSSTRRCSISSATWWRPRSGRRRCRTTRTSPSSANGRSRAAKDELLVELHKAREEIEDIEKKLAESERGRRDLEGEREVVPQSLADNEERQRAELTRLRDERTQLETTLKAEIDELKKRSAEELNVLSEQLLGELERTRTESAKAVEAAKNEQTEATERERKAAAESIQAKEAAHASELESLRQRMDHEAGEGDQRRQRELAEAETRRLVDLEAAEHRRLNELQTQLKEQKDDYESKLSTLEKLHYQEKGELADKHRGEVEQATGRASRRRRSCRLAPSSWAT
jgi:chromosome segregation ATPase